MDLLANESAFRLIAFLVGVVGFGGISWLAPRRSMPAVPLRRWTNNFALTVFNSLILRLGFPVVAVGVALYAEAHSFGLLNWLGWPWWFNGIFGFLLLDVVIYGQHRLMHSISWLWRLHRVHHTDVDFDVSTALRFHPIEIVLSMLVKMVVVGLFGIPAGAVVVFEIVLNLSAMFNHANWNIGWVDAPLRWFVVTPDMHRIHHSVVPVETNSNYGFFLSVWDRWLGTYREVPANDQATMQLGLSSFRSERDQTLLALLMQPWRDG